MSPWKKLSAKFWSNLRRVHLRTIIMVENESLVRESILAVINFNFVL
jgi:hypothetical protein